MATPRIAEQVGRVLAERYRLVAPIGTGASAHVYVADDVTLDRRVAVKVLHPALAEDESFLRRFRAEAQAVARLRHPHIMNVYDWGQDDDGPFLVLEYLDAGSLRDLLDTGRRLSPSQALQVALEGARGLDYAHRRGLVHRDVKPANLLFDDEGRLSIADFGIARALAEAAWTEPAGAVLGTARYASPEQARGSSVDGRSDVYSLALTIVEAVTGQVPFAADTTIATLMARLDRDIDVPPELGALAPVLAAAGRADRVERIDAGELARRLVTAASDLPRPAPLPLVASSFAAVVAPRQPAEDAPDRPDSPRRPERAPDDLTVIAAAPAAASAPAPSSARLFDADADLAAGPARRGARTRRQPAKSLRRRLGGRFAKFVVLAVVVAVLVPAGLLATGVTTPRHPVPDVSGMTIDMVAGTLGVRDEFVVREIPGTFYSEDVRAGAVIAQVPAPGANRKEGSIIGVQLSDGPAPRQVPDLTTLSPAPAQQAVEAQKLVFARAPDVFSETVVRDTVVDWSPKSVPVERDSTVIVTFSKGPAPRPVPGVLDRIYDEAAKFLESLGFKAKKEEAFHDKIEAGQVIGTRPPTNQPADFGSEVVVIVSKGKEMVAVPSLRNLDEGAAAVRLQAAGLRLGSRIGPANRNVFDSSPPANTSVAKGTAIDVYTR